MSLTIKERINDVINNENTHIKKALLSSYADMNIYNFYICRKPVEKILLSLLSNLSDAFNKLLHDERYSYDQIFHLSLIIEVIDETGKHCYIKTEKNPRVVFSYNDDLEPDTSDYYQIKAHNFKTSVSLGDLIRQTKKEMGDNFDKYSALVNNCQNYILSIIQAYFNLMHIPMPDVYKNYIFTPVNEILIKNYNTDLTKSTTSTIMNALTDTAHRFINPLLGKGRNDEKAILLNDVKCPLSSDDIINFFHGPQNVSIVKYSELDKFKNIDELLNLNQNNYIIVLVELEGAQRGHWVAFAKTAPNLISFFDSYGSAIERQLNYATEKAKKEVDLTRGKLLKLLINSNYDVEFSAHRLQQLTPDVMTCGRWCCVFLSSNSNTDEFYNYIKQLQQKYNNVSLDLLICYIYNILKNI
jgi:hypothetical protein